MVQKARYSVAMGLCCLLLTTTLLGADPTKAKNWIDQLRHPIPAVRVQAATKLAELGRLGELAETALEPLAKCLQDTDANLRLYASLALGRIEADTERSLILLIPLLADRDDHVRYSAEWSIAEIAKRVSVRESIDEDARHLLPVFESAEYELAKGSVQERNLQAVKLARTRLQNHSKQIVAPKVAPISQPSLPDPLPAPSVAEPKQPIAPIDPAMMDKAPIDNLDATLSLYKANDFVGRLQIVERMANGSEFDNSLRLAILKYELQSESDSSVATYAIARWQSSAQQLLSQLFSELWDSDPKGKWNEKYAEGLISRLKPVETRQLESLCKIATDPSRSDQLRLASLNAVQSAVTLQNLESIAATTIAPTLMSIAVNPMESDDIRCVAIETIASIQVGVNNMALPLINLLTQPQLPGELRAETAHALAKLAPGSVEAAGKIAGIMKGLRPEESLYGRLATSLGNFGATGAVGLDRLVVGLRSSEESTRLSCAKALENIGDPASRAATFLVARIIDPNETVAVKSQAAITIRRMGKNAAKMLSEQIQAPEATVREHVIRALSQTSDSTPALLDSYLSVLTDIYEKSPVRAAAATALGSLGPTAIAAVPALLKSCEPNQPSELRAAAMIALAHIAPQQASAVIRECLNDSEPLVRASASFGLHLCGDTAASLEALLQLIDGPESESLVLDMLADIGPSVVPHAIAIAESRDRSATARLCCVQASAAMSNAPWPAIVRLLNDDEIGDGVAAVLESADLFESDKAPLLLSLLRDGHVDKATYSRIMTVIEAEGFGGVGDEDTWANTLAINQPDAARALTSAKEKREMSAMQSSMVPHPAAPPRATAPNESSLISDESSSEFVPQAARNRLPPSKANEEADRKVSVFYGTNRSPIVAAGLQIKVGLTHVVLAAGLLAAMVCCFFLFPQHSNGRYAIASLVGMGTASTIALLIMSLTNWQGGTERLAYGGQYSEQVEYGVCEVSIPVVHQPGELESPQMFKLEIKPDIEKHVVLTNVGRLDLNAFHAALQREMDRKGKNIFVFIHGYNVSFEDAARRTGQMAYDLKFPGAPVFYSWPSQANWYSYGTDQDNIELSTNQIRDFLVDIATRSNADTVNLIAHSMGNVGLTAALSEIEQGVKPHFNQVVLAAPDIDANVFKNEIASKIVTKSRRTTLYTSKTDLALIASRYFNQGDRAGDSGAQVVILDGIETIDATAVDSSLLGHSYYGSNVTVLDDLGQLLQNQPIASRHYLKLIATGTQSYWAFEPMRISRTPSLEPGQRR
ncbi:MAG: alpha/beta hydrolase [Planctomycetota bacterium]|nr:alpha/beta hydrolase [Planctomycetota bacterium]